MHEAAARIGSFEQAEGGRIISQTDKYRSSQSVSQSVSQPVRQPTSQSVSQSVSQPVSQPCSQPVSQPVSQSVSQSVSRTDRQQNLFLTKFAAQFFLNVCIARLFLALSRATSFQQTKTLRKRNAKTHVTHRIACVFPT